MARLCFYALLTVVLLGIRSPDLRADTTELDRRLIEIDMQRNGHETPSQRLEQECLALIPKFSAPAEKGRIFAQIAANYAQDGLKTPDKTIEYARKALDEPLDAATRSLMYVYWADGLQARLGAAAASQAAARREIATVCLRGLKSIMDHGVPESPVDLPTVDRFEHGGDVNDPELRALAERHQRQLEARRDALLLNELHMFRGILIDKCAILFATAPDDEPAEVATGVFTIEQQRADVLRRIRERISTLKLAKTAATTKAAGNRH
jgi:hypothetical protein